MTSPLAIAQFARIVGRSDLLAQLGLPPDASVPVALEDEQRERARALAADRAGQIAEALVEEARANDDIQDAAAAAAYLEDRLAFLAALLTDETRDAIRASFRDATAAWG